MGILRGGLFLFVLFLSACNAKPRPIDYGTDGCHFCRMTIVDRQHAAQIVTQKGRIYSFDAIECMVNHLKDIDNGTVALFLVNDYTQPGELIDAKTAIYLISEGIPSPMGEFLTAFENKVDAQNAQNEHGGELYSWEELLSRFSL
ncbi:nitrous oxide reductase accessory protein NosL [Allomuricauda sp. SCSIO 65647]|uniref:nitrous oxide reductase accessory protein NosL n=1 Tax=Allomuricauda sp. SCSIO 65647 TaxID=2908843 RepID=UPI001F467EF8|nr:nitrous oxide reductase accessory protein NosL [Muricauda sp. SCSIO 65647]UJH68473.1 nitrous oxide reductase accessory protein NosL [Muricauda sp. SCSIO 65647]